MSQQDRIHAFACLLTPMPLPALGGPTGWRLHIIFFQAPRSPCFPELAEGLHISSGLETPWNRVVIVRVVNKPWRNAGFLFLTSICTWSYIVHEACCWQRVNTHLMTPGGNWNASYLLWIQTFVSVSTHHISIRATVSTSLHLPWVSRCGFLPSSTWLASPASNQAHQALQSVVAMPTAFWMLHPEMVHTHCTPGASRSSPTTASRYL